MYKKSSRQTILLTSVGKQDPYNQYQKPGPILSLLSEKSFDKIFLFSTSGTQKNAEDTSIIIKEKFKETNVEIIKTNIEDPYNYSFMIKEVRDLAIGNIYRTHQNSQFFILIGPGFPQMQTCWFLLASSGEIPATLLYIREEQYAGPGKNKIGEIDPRSKELPHIQPKISLREIKTVSEEKLKNVIEQIGIVGDDPKLKEAIIDSAKAANYEFPILILGETGTGKELIARLIHELSPRSKHTFFPFNCATLPEGTIEAELFGYKKGAFTGADEDKKGIIETCEDGTLFLDEIADLPPKAQAGLLRAIQFQNIIRLGDHQTKGVNVRFIGATNKNIKDEKIFRKDLYFRLSTIVIELPPLRERKPDIPKLALYFLKKFNEKHKKNIEFEQDLLAHLQEYEWKGNIRELSQVIERTVLLTESEKVTVDEFKKKYTHETAKYHPEIPELHYGFSLEDYLNKIRADIINKALEKANGNQSEAAKYLNITPQAINKFIKKKKDKV